jgi:hypothetical protein
MGVASATATQGGGWVVEEEEVLMTAAEDRTALALDPEAAAAAIGAQHSNNADNSITDGQAPASRRGAANPKAPTQPTKDGGGGGSVTQAGAATMGFLQPNEDTSGAAGVPQFTYCSTGRTECRAGPADTKFAGVFASHAHQHLGCH